MNNRDSPENKPIHKGALISCILVSIVCNLYAGLLAPNIPFIIRGYKDNVPETMVAVYTALTATFYFIGSTIGCICWGWVADRIGRKPTLIITLCLSAFCLVAFGMCNRIKPALFIRLLHGLVDGAIPVVKTIQTEISNSQNIAFVSSLFFVGSAIGGVVGPLLGGFLNKEENIKSIVKLFPIFHDYPYLFPVIIAATLMVLSTIFILFFCKETLPKIDRLASHTEDLAKWGSRSAELKQAFLEENSKTKAPTGWSLLAEKDSILMIIAYKTIALPFLSLPLALINFAMLSFGAILSVALTNPPSMAGFSLNSEGVSSLQSAVAFFQLLVVMIVPYLGKLALYKNIFGVCTFLYGVLICVYPFINRFAYMNEVVVFCILMCYRVFILINILLVMNVTMILFANIAYNEMRGFVMGACETIAGITRMLGPVIFSALYGWTCKQEPHGIISPYLAFYILGGIAMLGSIFLIWVSPETNKSKGSLVEKMRLEALQN